MQAQLPATDTTNGSSSREENFSKSASKLARKMTTTTHASIIFEITSILRLHE